MADLPPAAIPVLQSLQPYQRGDEARFHRLWLLDELWNTDKHRNLVLTVGSSSVLRWAFDKPVEYHYIRLKGFEKDGPLCRVFAYGERKLKYKTTPPFRIGFGEGGPYKPGIVVVTNLSRLHKFVRQDALPRLKRFLV